LSKSAGYPIQSFYVAVANRQAEIMMRIASEFGFTPASRGRLSTSVNQQKSLLDLMAAYDDDKDKEQ
jgi:phage terminase small subunit